MHCAVTHTFMVHQDNLQRESILLLSPGTHCAQQMAHNSPLRSSSLHAVNWLDSYIIIVMHIICHQTKHIWFLCPFGDQCHLDTSFGRLSKTNNDNNYI